MISPLATVVIPAYNQAKFLAQTIQSVLNQTYPNYELIVVNDASTDNSANVILEFNDNRIHSLEHKVNKGSDKARISGLNLSSGDLIIFLDQDDFLHGYFSTPMEKFF